MVSGWRESSAAWFSFRSFRKNTLNMNWILIAYLFGLLYLATHKEKIPGAGSLRTAWVWFALIPLSQFLFALFRAGNVNSPPDLALVEIWADGIGWLLLGISFLCLTSNIAGRQSKISEPGGAVNAAAPLR